MSVAVGPSQIGSLGAHAERDYVAGEVIHRMGGRRLSHVRCVAEIALRRIRIDDPLQIGRNAYIALDDLSIRFNHSCDPNAGLRHSDELFALRDIRCGDEITFDYAATVRPSYYSRFWTMACHCGAPNCRGTVGDLASVPPLVLQRYIEAGALQDYIVDYLQSKGHPLTGLPAASAPASSA